MSSTLLQLVQQATGEMGLTVPSTVINNNALDTVQTLYLINALGNELARQRDWQTLTKENRFNTVFYQYTGNTNSSTSITGMSSIVGLPSDSTFMVTGVGINQDTYVTAASGSTVTISQAATASQTGVTLTFSQTKYSLPSDYDRLIDRTNWDKSKHWEMLGPLTQQQVQWLKSGYISTGPRLRLYLAQNYFQIWPPQSTTEYLGYVYVSNQWVSTSSGTQPTKASFTLDTDTCVFSDRLMVLGLKLKYFSIKGFDTTNILKDYNMELDISKANDAGSPTLSMAPRRSSILIGWENIPDTNYGT